MFLAILANHSGEYEVLRRLGPNETLDCEHHAKVWADYMGVDLAQPNGHIPYGCGDIRVEIRSHKYADCSVWSAQDYYLAMHD